MAVDSKIFYFVSAVIIMQLLDMYNFNVGDCNFEATVVGENSRRKELRV
jgi:hypothetical protein